jgi:hypothetical protein
VARLRRRGVVDGVVVDREAAARTAVLGRVRGAGGGTVRLDGFERCIESVPAVALAAVLGAEVVVGIAICSTVFEGDVVGGRVSRRERACVVHVVLIAPSVIPLAADGRRVARNSRSCRRSRA